MCSATHARSQRQELWQFNPASVLRSGRTCVTARRPLRVCAVLNFLKRNQEPLPDQLPSTTLSWLKLKGLPHQELAARDVGEEGRGLVATRRISANEPMLRIPRSLVITADDASQQSALSLSARRAGLPDWSVLAMFLLDAKLRTDTEWSQYVAMLPDTSGCVLEWSQGQVDGLASGSQLHVGASNIRAAAELSWQGLKPLLADPATRDVVGCQPSRQDCQWAFSMLLSRLIRLQGLDDQEALVPWADLVNHSSESTKSLDWADGAVTFRPESPVARGEQLFCSYGAKSSAELLLSYGFVQAGVNPNETVPLKLELAHNDALFKAKKATLSAANMQTAATFPLRLNAFPEGLITFAALIGAKDEAMLRGAAAAHASGKQSEMTGATLCTALRLIRQACRQANNGIARASAKLKHSPKTGSVQQDDVCVEQLIAEVYVRELRVLNRAIFLLTQMIRESEQRAVDATILAGFTP